MGEYQKFSDDPKSGERPASLRSVAFCAVVFSTVAITAAVISIPMVFHYVQTLQANVQNELDYCKVKFYFKTLCQKLNMGKVC